MADPKTILTLECGQVLVFVLRSTTCHEVNGNRLFTGQSLEKRDLIAS